MPTIEVTQDQADALARGEQVSLRVPETDRHAAAVSDASAKFPVGTRVYDRRLAKHGVIAALSTYVTSVPLAGDGPAFWSDICQDVLISVKVDGYRGPPVGRRVEGLSIAPTIVKSTKIAVKPLSGHVYEVEYENGEPTRWRHIRSGWGVAPCTDWRTVGRSAFKDGARCLYTLVEVNR